MMKNLTDDLEEMKAQKKEEKNLLTIPQGGWSDPNKMTDDELIGVIMDKVELRVQKDFRTLDNDIQNLKMEHGAKIREKLDRKELEEVQKVLYLSVAEQLQEKTKKFAEKLEVKKLAKVVDKQIENLFSLIQAKLGAGSAEEGAILSRKPAGLTSCASCEKIIRNETQTMADHQAWNRLPYRDPSERIAKVGQGYSKMLKMVKPAEVTKLAEDQKPRMSETQNFHSLP